MCVGRRAPSGDGSPTQAAHSQVRVEVLLGQFKVEALLSEAGGFLVWLSSCALARAAWWRLSHTCGPESGPSGDSPLQANRSLCSLHVWRSGNLLCHTSCHSSPQRRTNRPRRCAVAPWRRCAVASMRRGAIGPWRRGAAVPLHRCAVAPGGQCAMPLHHCVVTSLRKRHSACVVSKERHV